MRKLLLATGCFVLLFPVSRASAQTADGQPPSRETVCDSESGAAFGHCNAYCEAMDCDSPAPQASETACNRVRRAWEKVKGEGARFPCDPLVNPTVCDVFADHWTAYLDPNGVRSCRCDQDGVGISWNFRTSLQDVTFGVLCFAAGGESSTWFNPNINTNGCVCSL